MTGLARRRALPRLSALVFLAVLAWGLVDALAGRALAQDLPAGPDLAVAAAEDRSGDLPLGAGRERPDRKTGLTRGGFSLAAVEAPRRKERAPQKPLAQAVILTADTLPFALPRSVARDWPAQRPLHSGEPRRPFLSQGPPPAKTS